MSQPVPRFMRDPELLRQLLALDAQLGAEGFAGHFSLEIHYCAGAPRTVKVRPPEQSFPLVEARGLTADDHPR